MDDYKAIFGDFKYSVFRDYEAEDQFIANMETLAEYWHRDCVIVRGDNPMIVGWLPWAMPEATNINRFVEV